MDDIVDDVMRKIRDAAGPKGAPPALLDALLGLRSSIRDLKAERDAYEEMARKVSGILSEMDVDLVLTRLLDAAVDLSGAERGFLVQKNAPDTFEVVRARDFKKADLDCVQEEFSRSLVEEAVRQGRLLLVADVTKWDGLEEHSSVRRQGIVSFMVVPFRSDGVVLGALYLDTRQAARMFTPALSQRVGLLAQQAAPALRQANLLADMKRANGELRAQFQRMVDIESVIGASPALRQALTAVACVAPSNAPVLITGETGTGKELVARIIHRNSPRSGLPMVTLNCAAIPANLLESELFGYREGAFTGAVRDYTGKIAQTAGGTLFLDEISELAPPLQAKLLRFVQYGELQRIGEERAIKVDTRVLAATNKDLSREVREGRFREDLFYRLSVINIALPALRDRREDIPLLVEHFLRTHGGKGMRVSKIPREVLRALESYDYPGNVRELESAVRRLCIMGGEGSFRLDLLPEAMRTRPGVTRPLPDKAGDLKREKRRLSTELERAFLLRALDRAEGNISEAARQAGMMRSRFQFLMKKHEIPSRRWTRGKA
ncbi:MAG: sigma 54-interacting transcriptional regulator [Planctomycetes bacterium]|nr:sigma 54-interacting transcriptional regulator [Planctomycetota bacterium]